MTGGPRTRGHGAVRWVVAVAMLAWVVAIVGCSGSRRGSVGVPIDQRPTPTPPPAEGMIPNETGGAPGALPEGASRPAPETASTADQRTATLARIVSDTTAAGAAVRKCGTRTLLPDQESVFETTRGYLVQARAALQRNDLWQAESLARRARQLALSLECH